MLRPLVDADAAPRESALAQCDKGYSIRTVDHRYTEWGEEGAEGAELYDRRSDPEELVNLADRAEHAETVASLSALLHDRIEAARRAPAGLKQILPGR